MKKIIITLITLVLLASQVFAVGNTDRIVGGDLDEHGCKGSAGYSWCESKNKCLRNWEEECEGANQQLVEAGIRLQQQTQNQERLQTHLQTALGNVESSQARMRLESNVDKFENTYQKRLQIMDNIELRNINSETGEVQIRVREQVKYLGFIKGTANIRFNINAEGKISEQAPWYHKFYTN